jgi:mono/diheme cytochrome c family protein
MNYCGLLIAAISVGTVCAETIPVANHSFEQTELGVDGKDVSSEVPGWQTSGVAGVFANIGKYGNEMDGAEGGQVGFLNGAKAGGFSQDVLPTMRPNTIYALSVSVGLREDSPLAKGSSLFLRLQAYDTNTGEFMRTLGLKEITVGTDGLSDSILTNVSAMFSSSSAAPKGGLRINIAVGEKDGDGKGDWTIDNVRLETKPAPVSVAVAVKQATRSSGAKTIYYNRDVRPIFSENCFACHGPDSAARKASLRLDRFEDAVAERKGVAAIIPGQPEKSALVERILATDPDDIMPPPKSHKKLTEQQKDLLRRWVAEGAEYELHWAYIAPKRPALPKVKNSGWIRNPIDNFILARLAQEKLQPAPEADRRTLARRWSLDLIGLPPTAAEVEAYVNDKSADADTKYIDKLVNSKHWGEHRGRYWLDAARYADTHGIHFDNFREMWSYRDWVIKAFNDNVPFDRFTMEQLAGDLLPNPTLEQQIASGFNRSHITSNEGGLIDEEYLVLYTRDRTETTSAVWLGMSANCATCHDHKFDPFTQREFYELSSFFNNTTIPARDGNRRDPPPVAVVPTPEDRDRWFELVKLGTKADEALQARRKAARPEYEGWLAEGTPEAFEKDIPTEDLLFHARLTEGKGETFKYVVREESRRFEAKTNLTWGSGYIGERSFKAARNDPAVELGDIGDFDKDESFSYGAWIKPADTEAAGAIIARMDREKSYRGWDMLYEKGRVAVHIVSQWPDDAIKVTTKTKLEAGKWAHVFATYDGSGKPAGVKLYINGKAAEHDVDRKTLKGSIRSDAPLTIGRRNGGNELDRVSIQDARIYGRALKAKEVEGLAQGTRSAWLVEKADKRTKEETDELFDRWLTRVDEPFKETTAKIAKLEAEQGEIKKRGTVAHVMSEKSEEAMAFILHRGEYDKRRDRVLADTPDILPPMPDDLPRTRLGFAQWLFLPEHPLTARVTVNRFWQEVFGNGLVRSAGDFGVAGELPSHPELLDWLAIEFRESGWDVKKLFKLLVTSAAYRQAATVTPDKLQKDPQNRLLSRGPRFRMDAEMVRDYALAVSGLLAPKVGGPSVKPYQPEGVWEAVAMPESNTKKYERDTGEKLYRRSLYTFWKRAAPPATMDIFNAPNRETCTVRRERTNTPLQALATLNDPQFVEAARHLAQLALKNGSTVQDRLDFVARRLLARPLRPQEYRVTESVLNDLLAHYEAAPKDAEALLAVGESKPDCSLPAPELAAYTLAVNQLMNLDEVLNK